MKRHRLDANNLSPLTTGSPQPGEPVFLAVGFLRRPHGVEGEILMEVLTDFPERLRAGKLVYVGEDHQPMRIAHKRPQDQALLITFPGIDTPEAAGTLRNKQVFIKADNLPELPEGEYYHHQLLGLKVINESGLELGLLTEIIETGANDVYVATSLEGKEILFPAIESVILGVDLERNEMRVKLPVWE
jgi:16S rRNA processing protein RimM